MSRPCVEKVIQRNEDYNNPSSFFAASRYSRRLFPSCLRSLPRSPGLLFALPRYHHVTPGYPLVTATCRANVTIAYESLKHTRRSSPSSLPPSVFHYPISFHPCPSLYSLSCFPLSISFPPALPYLSFPFPSLPFYPRPSLSSFLLSIYSPFPLPSCSSLPLPFALPSATMCCCHHALGGAALPVASDRAPHYSPSLHADPVMEWDLASPARSQALDRDGAGRASSSCRWLRCFNRPHAAPLVFRRSVRRDKWRRRIPSWASHIIGPWAPLPML